MKTEKAIFACGCFWGVQHQMERATGVIRSTAGYIGGHKENPTYPEVKAHTTGHAEAVLVEYDAEQTTYTDLCKLFFEIQTSGRKVIVELQDSLIPNTTYTIDFYFVFIEIELIGFRVAFDKNGRGCVYRTSGRSCNVGT